MINNFILYPEFKKYGIFFNDKKILKNIMKGKDNYLKENMVLIHHLLHG